MRKLFLKNVRKYTDPEELTTEMLNDLIDKILYCITISLAVIPDYRMLTSYLHMFAIGKIQRSVV